MGTIYIGAQRYSEAFAYNEPVTYCLLIALLFMAAAVAFNGIALLTSVWVKNTFVVMAAPTLLRGCVWDNTGESGRYRRYRSIS